jgi:ubiquinone/menaquinone biosynthesis C-methylase UbiE
VDLTQYRHVSQAVWERMAAGWDRRRQWIWDASRAVGEHLVAKLDPQPGQTILELAAGTGETGFAAAARVGEGGRLISTDFSPPMLDAARRRAEQLGLSNVDFRVMDAERMDLADDSVDGVLCRWGYMLMADPAAALSETRRVLRDGGRVALSVWGPPESNPWASVPRRTLAAEGHLSPPQPGEPGIFAMAAEERIRELLAGAGFGEIEIEPVASEWRFDDFDDYWGFLDELAGALALVLERLSDDQLAQVREALERNIEPFRSGGGYLFPGLALNAVAG